MTFSLQVTDEQDITALLEAAEEDEKSYPRTIIEPEVPQGPENLE